MGPRAASRAGKRGFTGNQLRLVHEQITRTQTSGKGSSVNDVTGVWIFFDPPYLDSCCCQNIPLHSEYIIFRLGSCVQKIKHHSKS